MKRLLLGVVVCLLCVSGVAQVQRIGGPPEVYTGTKHLYQVFFDKALAQDTKIVIRTGKYGTFADTRDTIMSVDVDKGRTYHEFWVSWGGTPTNNAKLTAYKFGGAPTSAKTYTVNVLQSYNPDPGAINDEEGKYIVGPGIIYPGEVVEYSANFLGWCQGPQEYLTGWKTDPNILQFLKRFDDGCFKSWKHQYLVKNINVESKNFIIEASTDDIWQGKVSDTYKYKRTITVKYRPTLSISTENSATCIDNTVNYYIEGIKSFMTNYTITWEAGQSMELVSGQGTPTATFKATGNGHATVKATVSYNGERFEIQNSEVWLGAPPKPTLLEYPWYERLFKPNATISLIVIGQYATNYIWNIEGGTILSTESTYPYNNGTAKVLTSSVPSGFNISVKAENDCGCSQAATGVTAVVEYIIPPGNGGLKPKPPGGGILLSAPLLPDLQPMSTATPVTVRVYNFNTGSLVHQQKNAVDFNLQQTTLKPGIYVVETTDSEGNRTQEKVYKRE